MPIDIYPWQQSKWQQLLALQQQDRIPHALLLVGPRYLGKLHFATHFAHNLLCSQPQSGLACGQCTSCHMSQTGHHPDLLFLAPEEEGKVIGIDALREIAPFLALRSHYHGRRIVIIQHAHMMSVAGANSVLKILEEPPAQALLVLITHKHRSLLSTIRSRCQNHIMVPPSQDQGSAWLNQARPGCDASLLLNLSGNAPLAALEMADKGFEQRQAWFTQFCGLLEGQKGPFALADSWLKGDFRQPLYWLGTWLMDLVRLAVSPNPPLLSNPDLQPQLLSYVSKLDQERLHKVLKQLMNLQYAQANTQLFLESLLVDCVRATHGR